MLQPKSADEARDHNVGVSLCRALHAYRKQQSPRSLKFFTGMVKDPRVVRLLDESVSAARAWLGSRDADRAVFDRLSLIRSRAFARAFAPIERAAGAKPG